MPKSSQYLGNLSEYFFFPNLYIKERNKFNITYILLYKSLIKKNNNKKKIKNCIRSSRILKKKKEEYIACKNKYIRMHILLRKFQSVVYIYIYFYELYIIILNIKFVKT